MPEKEVSKTQQCFFGSSYASSFSFAFYKIYKRQPKNRFRIRVVQIADNQSDTDSLPAIYVATNLFNAFGMLSGPTTSGATGMLSNDFVLGITPRNQFNTAAGTTSGVSTYSPIEFYADDISTSPFTVKYYDTASSSYGTASVGLTLVFEITELEEY